MQKRPDPAALAELSLLATNGVVLKDGFAPLRTVTPPETSGGAAGRAAVAVGAGILAAALGAPHMAFHAALAARQATSKDEEIRRPRSEGTAPKAMERLRRGIPRGEPSANEVLESLDRLARAPRDGVAWGAFLDAAGERVGVLRRAHLRARAAALLERQEP